jgi:hypothetical protein
MRETDRTLEIRFPVFLVGEKTPGGSYAAIVTDDGNWFPLFNSQELAEHYVEEAGGEFMPLKVDKEALAFSFLAHPDIRGCIFNPTVDAQYVQYLDRKNFI